MATNSSGFSSREKLALFGGLGFAALLLASAILWIFVIHDTFEQDNHDMLSNLADQASVLMDHGNEDAAYTKLTDLFQLLGKHRISDPALQNKLDGARNALADIQAKKATQIRQQAAEAQRQIEEQKQHDDVARKLQEKEDQIAAIRATVTGGAWLTRDNQESLLLRGMTVMLCHGDADQRDGEAVAASLTSMCRQGIADCGRMNRSVAGTDMGDASDQLEQRLRGLSKIVTEDYVGKPVGAKFDIRGLYVQIRETAKLVCVPEKVEAAVAEAYLTGGHGRNLSWDLTPDQIGSDEVWPKLLSQVVVAKAITDIDGKYLLGGLRAGQYYIYANSITASSAVEWLIPLEVKDNSNQTVDLDNSNAAMIVNSR